MISQTDYGLSSCLELVSMVMKGYRDKITQLETLRHPVM